MSQAMISVFVARALERLLRSDGALLERDVNEQAVAHHLANYIYEEIGDVFDVDVEYNRHFNEKKVILLGDRSAVVRPDIVVHERGSDENNVVAIEVKKFGADLERDREKLIALKQQYHYKHAAHVLVGFKDGKPAADLIWIAEA